MTLHLSHVCALFFVVLLIWGALKAIELRTRRRRVDTLERAILQRQRMMQEEHNEEEERGHRR